MRFLGDKEAEAATVAVRNRAGGDQGAMPLDEFVNILREEVEQKIIR